MKKLVWLPILGCLFFLPGCYTASLLEYDGLEPADITIPATVKSLSVTARCDLDSIYKASFLTSGKMAQFKRDSLMSKQMVLGCSDALVESPRFTINNPVIRRNLIGAYTDPAVKLPWDIVRAVAGDNTSDAVLSLEYATVDDTLKHVVQDGWLGTYEYTVKVKSFWRLYRLSDFQSKDFYFTDTVEFDVESPAEFTASPDQAIDCLKNALYEAGMRTARKLAPWWSIIQRYYFINGRLDFLTGGALMRDGKWKEAAEFWRPYTVSKNRHAAAKSTFNMAIISEMAGNMDAAEDWLKKSASFGMDPYYIDKYKSKLIKRKPETAKLDEQMGKKR